MKTLRNYVTRICQNRLVVYLLFLLAFRFLVVLYSSLPLVSILCILDAEIQGPSLRGPAQPQSRRCPSVPTSGTPGLDAATWLLPQLHLRPPRCIIRHKDPRWTQFSPPCALPNQTFLLWPQVLQLPLPGHVRWWTVPGIHTLNASSSRPFSSFI